MAGRKPATPWKSLTPAQRRAKNAPVRWSDSIPFEKCAASFDPPPGTVCLPSHESPKE